MGHTVAIIMCVAVCTLLTRALPFWIFGGKKEVSPIIQYLGRVLPSAIMTILVVYCLKDVSIFEGSRGFPEFAAILVVVVLHLWRRNTLLSIGVGTVFYMLMV